MDFSSGWSCGCYGLSRHHSDGWNLKAEIAMMRAEIRASIAESANDFYRQVNGSYVKKELYQTLSGRVDSCETRLNDMGD